MDAKTIRGLGPALDKFLAEFDDCFPRCDTRAHFPVYVNGQLSDLKRKSVEPIALASGVPVRTLQEFLSQYSWAEDRMIDQLQHIVVRDHSGPHSIGIIDETSFVKKGDKTPGVQRQHCGTVGKQDNCIVTVHLGYACGGFHCLLDGELFLPESWSDDRERCAEAGIPDDVVYRPKSLIGLELYDRARNNGVVFEWLTFDEWYGAKPEFLRGLDDRKQRFVAEVHKHFVGWIDPPKVTSRRYRRRRRQRIVAGGRRAQYVEDLAKNHPELRAQRWQPYRVKDGEKGPIVWETKHAMITPKDAEGLPAGKPYHLLIARNVLNRDDVKYFVSNAPPETSVETLLLVAFSRWPVERCFEDQKGEVGMAHYEGRRYIGLKRHLAITAVSYLFLSRVREDLEKKRAGADGVPGTSGGFGRDRVPVVEWTSNNGTGRQGGKHDRIPPASGRRRPCQPPQDNHSQTTRRRHQAHPNQKVQLGHELGNIAL